jgi:hypothetical protein
MGGGGMQQLGNYGGTQGVFNWGTQQPPSQGGFNQNQQNYIQSQGKLPGAFGGGALNPAQQNFFNAQGYLPKGFQSDLGQQYYRQQPQQQQYQPYGGVSGWTPAQQPQQGGFNQNQQNYIQSQGKLPAALGGGALNPAQQNFFNAQGYLPKGFQSDLGQQYYRQQPQQPQNMMAQYNPYGQYNPLGAGGGGPMQQLGGSNKGPAQSGGPPQGLSA